MLQLQDGDVLGGRGSRDANAVLKSMVVRAAKRPIALSREEAEERRVQDRKRLMGSLGLDPMPERKASGIRPGAMVATTL